MNWLGKLLAIVLMIGLFIPILIIFCPFILLGWLHSTVSLKAFLRREEGNFYLICTSRDNWHDFLRNNVIPILPASVRAVWHRRSRDGRYDGVFGHLAHSGIHSVSKPYLVAITKQALRVRSLNPILQGLKSEAKQSEEVREKCLKTIKTVQEELLSADQE